MLVPHDLETYVLGHPIWRSDTEPVFMPPFWAYQTCDCVKAGDVKVAGAGMLRELPAGHQYFAYVIQASPRQRPGASAFVLACGRVWSYMGERQSACYKLCCM